MKKFKLSTETNKCNLKFHVKHMYTHDIRRGKWTVFGWTHAGSEHVIKEFDQDQNHNYTSG